MDNISMMDMVMMRIVDAMYSIPDMLYVIMVVVAMGANFLSIMIGVCLTFWMDMGEIRYFVLFHKATSYFNLMRGSTAADTISAKILKVMTSAPRKIVLKSPVHYIMPATTLALYPIATIARLTRSSMLEDATVPKRAVTGNDLPIKSVAFCPFVFAVMLSPKSPCSTFPLHDLPEAVCWK